MRASKLLELYHKALVEGKEEAELSVPVNNNSEHPQAPQYRNNFCAVWKNKKKGVSKTEE